MIFKTISNTFIIKKPSVFESDLKFHQSIVGKRKYEILKRGNEIWISRRTNSIVDFLWRRAFFYTVEAKGFVEETNLDVILKVTFQYKKWYKYSLVLGIFFLSLLVLLTSELDKTAGVFLFLIVLVFSFIAICHGRFAASRLLLNLTKDISSIS